MREIICAVIGDSRIGKEKNVRTMSEKVWNLIGGN